MSSGYDDDRYDDRRGDRYDDRDDRDDREGDDATDIAAARARVQAPAVTMLVMAAVSLLLIPMGALNFITLPATMEAQRKQIDQDPNMPPAQKQQVKDILKLYQDVFLIVLPFTLTFQAVVGVLCVIGSLKMKNLSSRGWAKATAILNIVSLGHGCCFLTLPVGIWAVTVLMKPEVHAGFEAAARARDRGDANPDRNEY